MPTCERQQPERPLSGRHFPTHSSVVVAGTGEPVWPGCCEAEGLHTARGKGSDPPSPRCHQLRTKAPTSTARPSSFRSPCGPAREQTAPSPHCAAPSATPWPVPSWSRLGPVACPAHPACRPSCPAPLDRRPQTQGFSPLSEPGPEPQLPPTPLTWVRRGRRRRQRNRAARAPTYRAESRQLAPGQTAGPVRQRQCHTF